MINIPIILTLNMISVFKFWTIGGIFLYMFSDALLFDMVLNTAFQDGIDSIQDLNVRDMSLGIKTIKSWSKLKSVTKLIPVLWPDMQKLVEVMKTSDYDYGILGMIIKCQYCNYLTDTLLRWENFLLWYMGWDGQDDLGQSAQWWEICCLRYNYWWYKQMVVRM